MNQNPIEGGLKAAFNKTDLDLSKSPIDVSYSGSTCILIYIDYNKLICANLGDSRALIGFKNNSQWIINPLSTD